MSDPGLDWVRLSYHTMSTFAACERAGYWRQAVGVKPRRGEQFSEALETGIVGHAFMEWHYHPERDAPDGCRLDGADGAPSVRSEKDIIEWFCDPQQIGPDTIRPAFRATSVMVARDAFQRYREYFAERGDAIANLIVGNPEFELAADLKEILPPLQGRRPIPYQARADAITLSPFGVTQRAAVEATPQGVYVVEHKFVKRVSPTTVVNYSGSGQVVGLPTVFNASRDLVAKYGPAKGVLVNLIPKEWTGSTKPHREWVSVSEHHQRRFAEAAGDTLRALRRAQKYNEWPQRGMLSGKCVDALTGWACPFLDICRTGVLSTAEFVWPRENTERILRDGHARLVSPFAANLQAASDTPDPPAPFEDVDGDFDDN